MISYVEDFYVRLGSRIRDERKRSGLTQEAVAARLSLSRASVVNIEKGRQRLAVHQLVELANVLGCEVTDLLGDGFMNKDDFVAAVRARSASTSDVRQ